jgi:hypothetical protein
MVAGTIATNPTTSLYGTQGSKHGDIESHRERIRDFCEARRGRYRDQSADLRTDEEPT